MWFEFVKVVVGFSVLICVNLFVITNKRFNYKLTMIPLNRKIKKEKEN